VSEDQIFPEIDDSDDTEALAELAKAALFPETPVEPSTSNLATTMDNVISFQDVNGNRQYAVPETKEEVDLFNTFQQYSENTRRRLIELQKLMPKYESKSLDIPETYPVEYDDMFLAMLDLV
jgi:hypothetical protein